MKVRSNKACGALTDPFDAVPFVPDGVEMREDSAGNLQLRVESQLSPFRKKVAGWLGQDHSSKVALDEHGTFFVQQIDGQRDLRQIVDAMVERSGRARKDVEEGVILYTKKLMVKNMVALKVMNE